MILLLLVNLATGFAEEIAKLFPNLFGQASALLVPNQAIPSPTPRHGLKIGVVLSGGQAPGGHNVIAGIFGENQNRMESNYDLV